MRLDPKEAKLITQLRHTPTCKMTVVKYGGDIRAIRTEIDVDLADKAARENVSRGTRQETVKISEPQKSEQSLVNPELIPVEEA